MIITITVSVVDDNWTDLTRKTTVDQDPPFGMRHKTVKVARAAALRGAKSDLDRLLAQAVEIPFVDESGAVA